MKDRCYEVVTSESTIFNEVKEKACSKLSQNVGGSIFTFLSRSIFIEN